MHLSTTSRSKPVTLKSHLYLQIYVCIFICTWIWTLLGASDIKVWLLENVLLFLLIGAGTLTYKRFALSNTSYILIISFLLLHLYGARFTYEDNPLGLWLQQVTNGPRNSYDRIVHFAFGFFISYPLWEIGLKYARFTNAVAIMVAVVGITFLGAWYEIIEWVVGGIFFPEQGIAFVGIQGDNWDTQKDIFLAIVGSLIMSACIFLCKGRILAH
jgi:putative membrane protein